MKVLVTGGAGFIGSAVCRRLVRRGHTVLNIDKLTYAANLNNLTEITNAPDYSFRQADIADSDAMAAAFADFEPDSVMHLAAESHVDRSIRDAGAFIQTNVVGTVVLLEAARHYWLAAGRPEGFRFHHVSTDEVFGDLGPDDPPFDETTAYAPSSPYSASKAASDHMVRAWHRTYGLPVLLSNCSNNYGPGQFPEKLIPLMIVQALAGNSLPVYGAGQNIRDWLYVEDHAEALETVLTQGQVGRTYTVGGDCELSNNAVVAQICALLDQRFPKPNGSYAEQITYVTDRLGHDRRYAVDFTRIRQDLGWRPRHDFSAGLEKTLDWVVAHYMPNAKNRG